MGTNWFMPAFVNRRFGESGINLEEGTMVCCFDLKKSRNDWRISELVIIEPGTLREDAPNVKWRNDDSDSSSPGWRAIVFERDCDGG
jgi:hypothetical protein